MSHDSNSSTPKLADDPVDYDALSDAGDQLGGDDFEFVIAHRLDGTLVHGQGAVEADFVIVQAEVQSIRHLKFAPSLTHTRRIPSSLGMRSR